MFEFATTSRILFGTGTLTEAPGIIAAFGRRILIVTGSSQGREAPLAGLLDKSSLAVEVLRIRREPQVEDIQQGVALCRASGIEVVVGFGGGSAVDAAKAIAAVVTNPGELLDYLEVIGLGLQLKAPGLPCIAIPTTAGTGAEVTRNAVIDVPAQSTKVSLRGPHVLPAVAIIDPQLALTVPAAVTAATGFDALTQVIEPYLCTRANPLTDALAREGIRIAADHLPRAYANGGDLAAREGMAMVRLLGGMFRAPHGALCAALLGPTLRTNLKAVRASTEPSRDNILQRFQDIARILCSRSDATPEDAIDWVDTHTRSLRIPKLSSYGVGPERFGQLIERALRASSMKYNPVKLMPEEISCILRTSL